MTLTAATVLVAVATFVLALVTAVTLVVTIRRDDAKRREDRQRDDELRTEQRTRDDQLRQEAIEEAERRERAERTAGEDYEARQVLDRIDEMRGILTVSTPHFYPIKQVRGAWVYEQGSGNLSAIEFDPAGHDDPRDDNACTTTTSRCGQIVKPRRSYALPIGMAIFTFGTGDTPSEASKVWTSSKLRAK